MSSRMVSTLSAVCMVLAASSCRTEPDGRIRVTLSGSLKVQLLLRFNEVVAEVARTVR